MAEPAARAASASQGSHITKSESNKLHAVRSHTPADGTVNPSDIQLNADNPQLPKSYPGPAKTAIIMASLYISIFLIALDRTIIGVAVPKITDEFHSIDDIGWYGSAYMLTACGFILFYGRIYTFFKTKPVFLTGITLFEIGSALCGAAPNSTALIIGRAIAGFGSSGIFTGAIMILLNTVPLHRRPLYQGLFGACFGVASVAGPLIGGAFTQGKASWRWCFYINLPLGGATIAALMLFLHLEENKPKLPLKDKLRQLDPLGTFFFLPGIVALLLALQWGGVQYSWGSGRVVGCLVAFAVLFSAFVVVQVINRNKNPTIPTRILFERSVSFGGLYQLTLGGTFLSAVVYLPLWFQAIKGVSPVKSGIDTIPLVLGLVLLSIISGIIVQRVGYYTQFLWLGSIFMSIGQGLLTTFSTTTNHAKWIGYQVIAGMGVGMGMQQSNIAVQTCLPDNDVPIGTAIIFFFQTFGGAIFVSVAQNTFLDKFVSGLKGIPGVNPAIVSETGATALKDHVPKALLPQVLTVYNYALTHGPFLMSTILACISIFGAAGMEWRSVKEKKPQEQGVEGKSQKSVKDIESGRQSVDAAGQEPELREAGDVEKKETAA